MRIRSYRRGRRSFARRRSSLVRSYRRGRRSFARRRSYRR